MRSTHSKKPRNVAVAACAALAASVGLAGAANQTESQTIDQVQRYCTTSWRNAGIDPQDWSDCTQEAISELLERVPGDRLDAAFDESESPERRELKRAIWRTIQRWRRAERHGALDGARIADSASFEADYDTADWLSAAIEKLSPRQQTILTLWSRGWSIDDIADELRMSAPRASDEKYKAIRKLKTLLGDA